MTSGCSSRSWPGLDPLEDEEGRAHGLAFMIVMLVVGVLTDGAFGVVDNALRRRRGLVELAT